MIFRYDFSHQQKKSLSVAMLHSHVAPYWGMKTGKIEFNSLQLSKRTGEIKVALIENNVIIQGKAITVFKIECIF